MSFLSRSGRASSMEVALFTRKLALLTSAGVPLLQGLEILRSQAKTPAFQEVLGALRADIQGGMSPCEAFSRHPRAFPEPYCSMVRAGELAGTLDTHFGRLAVLLEKDHALKLKVASAFDPPLRLFVVCGLLTILLLATMASRYFLLFFAALPALYWGFRRIYACPGGRAWIDSRALRLPVIGELLRHAVVAKIARSYAALIRAGIPLGPALETATAAAGFAGIAAPLPRRPGGLAIFDEMVLRLMSVHDEGGLILDKALDEIADCYDAEVDADALAVRSMAETAVLLVLAAATPIFFLVMRAP